MSEHGLQKLTTAAHLAREELEAFVRTVGPQPELERKLRLLDICAGVDPDPERSAGRLHSELGPDSDAAMAAVADGETQAERDALEQLRLGAGALYDTKGQLV